MTNLQMKNKRKVGCAIYYMAFGGVDKRKKTNLDLADQIYV